MNMMIFIFMLPILMLLVSIIYFIICIMSDKEYNFEAKQMFESGVEMNNFTRIPFSIQFFFIAFIFIIFDLEIIVLLSLFFSNYNMYNLIVLLLFLVFIFVSLLYEWKFNKLLWIK